MSMPIPKILGCNKHVTYLLHQSYKVVTKLSLACQNLVTCMSQPCGNHGIETVTSMFIGCNQVVTLSSIANYLTLLRCDNLARSRDMQYIYIIYIVITTL